VKGRWLDNFRVYVIVAYAEVGSAIVEFSKPFYSPHEVATIAGVHSSTILNYIASGRLYAVKLSERTYRIPVRAVMGLLEPERVSASSIVVEPDADVEHDLASEGAERARA
jgi:excisionase family DNA binding protein